MRTIVLVIVICTAACAPVNPQGFDGGRPSAPPKTYALSDAPAATPRPPVVAHPTLEPLPLGEAPTVIRSFDLGSTPKTGIAAKKLFATPYSPEMTQALPDQEEILEVEVEIYEELVATDDLTYADLDDRNGLSITVTGRFSHSKYLHGILTLDNGLMIWLPHLDQFQKGDDWLRYVGHNCTASGIMQTNTFDIPGYTGPSIDLRSFYGIGE